MIQLSHSSFKMSPIIHIVLGGLNFDCLGSRQITVLLHQLASLIKICFDVSPKRNNAPRLQNPLQIGNELRLHDTSSPVPLFPPRIRKVNMHAGSAFGRQEFTKQLQSITSQHVCISASVFGQSVGSKPAIFFGNFITQKVSRRHAFRFVQQKQSFAAADFDFQILRNGSVLLIGVRLGSPVSV